MSGRTPVTLPDGRRVIGFRKTLRRNPRPAEPGPSLPFKLSFILPGPLSGLVSPGPTGIAGVTVHPLHRVEVTGHGLEWVCRQASVFLASIAPKQNLELPFAIERGAYKTSATMIFVPGASVIFPRAVKKALVFAVNGNG